LNLDGDVAGYVNRLRAHYERCFQGRCADRTWPFGPARQMPRPFRVCEFAPSAERSMWTYATLGMSLGMSDDPIEIHIVSPVQERSLVELLTAIAHYHRTGARLGVGHTINFGRPWLPESGCRFGLISLPYLDGPELEEFGWLDSLVRCLWLIPITEAEREFKKARGLDDLEALFEEKGLDYLNPHRASITET